MTAFAAHLRNTAILDIIRAEFELRELGSRTPDDRMRTHVAMAAEYLRLALNSLKHE